MKRENNDQRIIMNYFVGYGKKTVWFTEFFLNEAKDMSSEAFRIYMEVLNRTKGFNVVVVK